MVKGARSSAGSYMLDELQSEYDATVVHNIREHDAIIFGKVVMYFYLQSL
jgi:Asp-tRNA(Asn)/Glu-tRNA(Gln) amidotransferase A subunit family amidase